MKKLLLLLYSILFISCISQNKLPESETKNPVRIRYSKINNSFEKFDGDKIYGEVKQKNIDTIYLYYRQDGFFINDKNGNHLINYHKFIGDKFGYYGYDYSQDSIIGIFREFYPNKNIRTKGLYCWFGFKIGKWYTFSEEGKLISVEDFDNGYKFNANKIFIYCKKNKIPLKKTGYYKTFYPYNTKIRKFKSDEDNKNYWIIKYPDYEKQKDITIQIDALSGNVSKKTEEPFYIGE